MGKDENHNENVIIRFNSMIQEANPSIQINEQFENTTSFAVYGNIMVNPTEVYIQVPFTLSYEEKNLTSTVDVGFANSNSDLHINSSSAAFGYCANIQAPFPNDDIDGDLRVLSTLNVGADE